MKRIVIIGGGIAGLAAAYALREQAGAANERLEVMLLEKRERLGGNIRTEKADGFLIEGGPDCFLSEKPWAMELCGKIGISDKFLPTNEGHKKTFVLSGKRLHELPEGVILMVPTKILPLAFSSLITMGGKIRMALELFIPRKKDKSDETLGDFVRRRLGEEALIKIAEPLVAGVHAGDPETMSVRASFPKFVQMEEEYGSLIRGMLKKMELMKKARAKVSGHGGGEKKRVTMFMTLRDGLSDMVDTLTAKIKEYKNTGLRTGVSVKGISKRDGGFEIEIEGGQPVFADAVIIAAPAYAASSILSGIDKELSKLLLTIPYVSTATVSIAFKKKDIEHPLNGFGFVVPKVEGRKIMAATWTSVKFSRRAPDDSVLIRCFVGGSKNAGLVNLDDEEMIRMVRLELKEIMGITAEPVLARVFRWKDSMPQYTVGHEERISKIEKLVSAHPGLYLSGSAYYGIGISDSIRTSNEAAKKALSHLNA